jgi:hypothetical protein
MLPEDRRPEIYLYGLSLRNYGVESILTSINIINEPIDGALLVGPPFGNELWNELVADRDPGRSPVTSTPSRSMPKLGSGLHDQTVVRRRPWTSRPLSRRTGSISVVREVPRNR